MCVHRLYLYKMPMNHKRFRSEPSASPNSQISEDELSGALEVVAETLHGVAGSGLFDTRAFSTSDAQRTLQLLVQVRCRGDPQADPDGVPSYTGIFMKIPVEITVTRGNPHHWSIWREPDHPRGNPLAERTRSPQIEPEGTLLRGNPRSGENKIAPNQK